MDRQDHRASVPAFGNLSDPWCVSMLLVRGSRDDAVLLQTLESGVTVEIKGDAVVARLRCPLTAANPGNGIVSVPDDTGGTQVAMGMTIYHRVRWYSREHMRVGETQRDGISFDLGRSHQHWSTVRRPLPA